MASAYWGPLPGLLLPAAHCIQGRTLKSSSSSGLERAVTKVPSIQAQAHALEPAYGSSATHCSLIGEPRCREGSHLKTLGTQPEEQSLPTIL